jgi:hypothetical protein
LGLCQTKPYTICKLRITAFAFLLRLIIIYFHKFLNRNN